MLLSICLASHQKLFFFCTEKQPDIWPSRQKVTICFVMSYAFSSKDQISLHLMKISDDDWWSIQYFALNPFYFLKSCYVLISIFFEGLNRSACIIISNCIRSYLVIGMWSYYELWYYKNRIKIPFSLSNMRLEHFWHCVKTKLAKNFDAGLIKKFR